MNQDDRCPTCVETEREHPTIHEDEPGYQCPDCGGSGKAADAISLDATLPAPSAEPKLIGHVDHGPRRLTTLIVLTQATQ